jgi:hypothetical protein
MLADGRLLLVRRGDEGDADQLESIQTPPPPSRGFFLASKSADNEIKFFFEGELETTYNLLTSNDLNTWTLSAGGLTVGPSVWPNECYDDNGLTSKQRFYKFQKTESR